jgi:REP element-mobilizing transposase RayT
MNNPKIYYHRHLPHYQPPEAAFHVVFRLAGSLPLEVITEMKREREFEEKLIAGMKNNKQKHEEWRAHHEAYFEKFDALLNEVGSGPRWLSEPAVADITAGAIHHRDRKVYDLLAYCIMPNHVHLVLSNVGRVADPTEERENDKRVLRIDNPEPSGRDGVPSYVLTDVIGSLKKYTALRANRILGRNGTFWQNESYDHVIRDDEKYERTILYVIYNPVKASLVQSWEQWPWTYCKPGIL